jgi:drug/metabolite transporter superfamily protein YnfA
MAVETKTSADKPTLGSSRTTAVWVALGAIAAAAAPHFFLQTPLGFYGESNVNGWLGLTIWGPTFLAAVALFVGADAGTDTNKPLVDNVDVRMAAAASVPIVVVVALCAINFDGYQHIGDWSKLGLAMAVYGGIFAVGTFFWQAFVQRVVLRGWSSFVRPLVVTALGAALWLPFLVGHPWSKVGEPLAEYAIVYFGLALLYELGLSVWVCMGAGLLMGMGYAFAHQMTFF